MRRSSPHGAAPAAAAPKRASVEWRDSSPEAATTDLRPARRLARTWLASSSASAGSAALSLAATVLVVRGFGPAAYADYVVDLARLGVLSILLEAVPSSYAVYRWQDDEDWSRAMAAHALLGVVVLPLAVAAAASIGFHAFSGWMLPYVAALGLKRYLDARLQSSGRLGEFLAIDTLAAAVRLVLLAGCLAQNVPATTAIWGSLALGIGFAQLAWLSRNRPVLHELRAALDIRAWRVLLDARRALTPYYLGAALKRVKDNLVPLVAELVFSSQSALAAFFLAYRGVGFATGQVRIVEALLNHRPAMRALSGMPAARALIAAAAQVLAILASAALTLASGTTLDPLLMLASSALLWPVVFNVTARAEAFSRYDAPVVNAALAAAIVTAAALSLAMRLADMQSLHVFSFGLVAMETAALAVYARCASGRGAWSLARRTAT